MARPTKLTPVRHARIIELLRDGVPFATACRSVGVRPSTAYDWLYRGWGTHPSRPPTPAYVAFAEAVDAVFPGGFAERYDGEDEFAEAQSSEETESGEGFCEFRDSVARASAEAEPEFAEGFPTRHAIARTRARARPGKASESPAKRKHVAPRCPG